MKWQQTLIFLITYLVVPTLAGAGALLEPAIAKWLLLATTVVSGAATAWARQLPSVKGETSNETH